MSSNDNRLEIDCPKCLRNGANQSCELCGGIGKIFHIDKEDSLKDAFKRLGKLTFPLTILFAASYGFFYLYYCFNTEDKSCGTLSGRIFPFLAIVFFLSSLAAILWAIQDYWRLRKIGIKMHEWIPPGTSQHDTWTNPFSFHELAESHREWSELWFSWCLAIFLAGVTYAVLSMNLNPPINKNVTSWPIAIHSIVNTLAPNGFIYLLFGVVWYWASRHYKSHWHNFVVNAYRHRALRRFWELRDDIQKNILEKPELNEHHAKARETILELYRLSGVLLLIPGDSSYLEKMGTDEISKALSRLEETTKVFARTNTP